LPAYRPLKAPHVVHPRKARMIVCLRVVPHQAAGGTLWGHLRRAIREAAKHYD
jgi:hypothetical protein